MRPAPPIQATAPDRRRAISELSSYARFSCLKTLRRSRTGPTSPIRSVTPGRFVRVLRDGVGRAENLRGLLVQRQVIVAEARSRDMPVGHCVHPRNGLCLFLMVKVFTDHRACLNVRVSVCRFLLQSTCGSERRHSLSGCSLRPSCTKQIRLMVMAAVPTAADHVRSGVLTESRLAVRQRCRCRRAAGSGR